MFEQFFGKPFWTIFCILWAVFGLSILVFETAAVPFVLAGVGIAVFVLFWKKPEYGLCAAFAELFANSHGHLMSVDVFGFRFGLRMTVFVAVMLAWVIAWLRVPRRLERLKQAVTDNRFLLFVPLLIAVCLGFVPGVLANPGNAFSDANAYLYLAYLLPIFSIEWTSPRRRLLLQTLMAGALYVSILTLGILFVFTHAVPVQLVDVYRFLRDTRTAELTQMDSGLFRVFLQAQFSAAVMALFIAPFLFMRDLVRRERRVAWLVLVLCLSPVLISLSRSFWFGLACAVPVFLFLIWKGMKPPLASFGSGVGLSIASIFVSSVIMAIVILFPVAAQRGNTLFSLRTFFSSRGIEKGDVAISSRWNLLPEMMELISARPLQGYGFGKEVTFVTDDPRARAINPDGTWTTYALEWGWLELWLKMGLLGPIAFVYLFASLIRRLFPMVRQEQAWLSIACISSLIMLAGTHVFSPYLNHPIGLGLLLFMVPFLSKQNVLPRRGSAVPIESAKAKTAAQPSVAPAISE